MVKLFFGKSYMEKILSAKKIELILTLMLFVIISCNKKQEKMSTVINVAKKTAIEQTDTQRVIISIDNEDHKDTCLLDVNNRISQVGGYFFNLDRNDTIYYHFKNNRLVGYNYASSLRDDKEDSLNVINTVNAVYNEYIFLKHKGIVFPLYDINWEEMHDVYVVMTGAKNVEKNNEEDSINITPNEPFQRNCFGTTIDGFLTNDSKLIRLKLCIDRKKRIVSEDYDFTDLKIRRTYEYLTKGYKIKVYQDGELYYWINYKANFNI